MALLDRRIIYTVVVALLLTIAAGLASFLTAGPGHSPRAAICAGNKYLWNGKQVCANIDPDH